ncbi:MAG: FtsX-like permease family protein [Lachnospiraceae bacterium]|nr:FtsX-like permease family protein [Lachnospiraceae bacterium]
MIANNNKKAARKLAFESLHAGKMRNFFIILTVILSAGLLSGIAFFYSASDIKEERELEKMQHVIYYDMTEEQIEKMKTDEEIESMFAYKNAGSIEEKNYLIVPFYMELTDTSMEQVSIVNGHYPKKSDEVAVDTSYLEERGMEAKTGQKITVTFLDGTSKEFIISGLTNRDVESKVYQIYFSKEYADTMTPLKEIAYSAAVRIKDADRMSEQEFLQDIRELGAKYGISRPNVNENNAFTLSLTMTKQEIILLLLIGIGILFVSVLVIYSIFYISVVSQIRQFGQLRTIGMTKKQIRRMVHIEGTVLCLIGAPVGIVIGLLASILILPDGFSLIRTIIISILVVVVNWLTVQLSIRKPASLASLVSPIEATRTAASSLDLSGRRKAGNGRLSPYRLAIISSDRNKSKYRMTAISLGIGGILFLIGATVVISMSREGYSRQGVFQYGEYEIYLSNNAAENNPSGYNGLQTNNPLSKKLVSQIKEIDGVKDVITQDKIEIQFEYNDYSSNDSFITFAKDDTEVINRYLKTGELSYDTAVSENQLIICNNSVAEEIFGWKFKTGDTIRISWFDGETQRNADFTIVGELNNDIYEDDAGYRIVYNCGWFVVPEQTIKNMMVDGFDTTRNLIVSSDREKEAEIEEKLQEIVDANPMLRMDTLRQRLLKDEAMFNSLYGILFGFSAFIIGFSFINLINTLVTNVMTRKQEFAMLQSIGMTGKQLSRMIQAEGLILAVKNVVITIVGGSAFGYATVWLMKKVGASYMQWEFPLWYLLGYTALIIIVPVLISYIAIHLLHRKPLVETLKQE